MQQTKDLPSGGQQADVGASESSDWTSARSLSCAARSVFVQLHEASFLVSFASG